MSTSTSPTARTLATVPVLRSAAVSGLVVSGLIHLSLVPGHLALTPALGLGFLAAGVGQAGIAAALIFRSSRIVLLAAIALSTFSLAAYAVDVTVGLPGTSHAAAHAEAPGHGHEAPGEGVLTTTRDLAAIGAKSAELVTLLAVVSLYRREFR